MCPHQHQNFRISFSTNFVLHLDNIFYFQRTKLFNRIWLHQKNGVPAHESVVSNWEMWLLNSSFIPAFIHYISQFVHIISGVACACKCSSVWWNYSVTAKTNRWWCSTNRLSFLAIFFYSSLPVSSSIFQQHLWQCCKPFMVFLLWRQTFEPSFLSAFEARQNKNINILWCWH